MSDDHGSRDELLAELKRLRARVKHLETQKGPWSVEDALVDVPDTMRETFRNAQDHVRSYFSEARIDPRSARLEFSGERYILIRAASMSTEFFDLVTSLYGDRGPEEARSVALGFLFDLAHALGKADAAVFHERMQVTDPVEKLSAGPIHFAFAGWATVDILPESHPSPDEDFFLIYNHPYSFEAEAWLKRWSRPDFPVCVMNAGYSSGWCEKSFDVPLVATEIECRAMGHSQCRFIMAPPSRIQAHLDRLHAGSRARTDALPRSLEIPEFFRRKRLEDELRRARDDLEARVTERTSELSRRNVELQKVNERLAELHAAQEEFVAMISHELRTPLVTGLGYVELLRSGQLGELTEEARSGTQVALRNLRRLAGLVEDILEYHRLSHPRHGPDIQPKQFDIGRLMIECGDDFRVRTNVPATRLKVRIPEGLPEVHADEEMIRRVLANLLDNADRHAGRDAAITMSAEAVAEGTVRVQVADNGVGMPPELTERAFEPFVQCSDDEQGVGLGLTIVRRILESHDARVDLQSEEGRGTTIGFHLPVRTAAEPRIDEAPETDAPVESVTAGNLVLVVDDDKDTRSFLELALQGHGYRVATAATAEAALQMLRDTEPDLLLVDLTLPGMSGIDLCRAVKSDLRLARAPFYLFTARAEETTKLRAQDAGADGYLVKPVDLQVLLESIRQAIDPEE